MYSRIGIPWLVYDRIQAVGVTDCRIKKMVENTENQKKVEMPENDTVLCVTRYTSAKI